MTNFERIKEMNVRELADMLADPNSFEACRNCSYLFKDAVNERCNAPSGFICIKEYASALIQEWLESECDSEATDTIEALTAKLQAANMERSERYYNSGWIPCSERLPEDGVDVLVWYEYFRYGEYNRLFQTKGISYMYNGKWSGFVNGESGWSQLSVLAWQPLPKPYKGGE